MEIVFEEIDDQIGLGTLPAEERESTAATAAAEAAVRGIGECLLPTTDALVEETGIEAEREGRVSVDVGGGV